MVLRRLTSECQDEYSCPGIWQDDDPGDEDAIVVGKLLDPSPVPLGPGERAVRLPWRVVRDAAPQ